MNVGYMGQSEIKSEIEFFGVCLIFDDTNQIRNHAVMVEFESMYLDNSKVNIQHRPFI